MPITHFEKLTEELTEFELSIESFVASALRECANEDKAKKSKELVEIINYRIATQFDPKAAKLTDVRLRKFVNYYRSSGFMPVCSTSKGYFISFENAVLQLQVKSLKERASGITSAARGLEKWIK